MSPDQKTVQKVIDTFDAVGLEAILVGNGGAQLHSAPVYTIDLDFLVRGTPLNRKKLASAASRFGPSVKVRPINDLTDSVRFHGIDPPVDVLFALGGGLRFESVRSRATRISPSSGRVWLASLADIIKAKEAANHPKDLGSLVQLRATLATTTTYAGELRKDDPPKVAEREVKYRSRGRRSNRIQRSRPSMH